MPAARGVESNRRPILAAEPPHLCSQRNGCLAGHKTPRDCMGGEAMAHAGWAPLARRVPRTSWGDFYEVARERPRDFRLGEWFWPTIDLWAVLVTLASPFVAVLTLALIPIRLLPPRPRSRRLSRQPGMTAACASAVAISLIGLPVIGVVLLSSTGGASARFVAIDVIQLSPMVIGLAVLVGG